MSGTSTSTKRSRCVPLLLSLMATTALGDVGDVSESAAPQATEADPSADGAGNLEDLGAIAPAVEAAPPPRPVHNPSENLERIAKTASTRRSYQRAHPQSDTDVHSNFLGVVNVEKFIEAYGGEANLVSHIAASAKPHTNHSGYQLTPIVESGPQITSRSSTGDCFIRAYTAHSALLDAAARGEEGAAAPAMDLKTDALVPCLTVTNETDADSAYQVRDALVQRWPAVRAEDFDNDEELQEARYIAYCKSAVKELATNGIQYSEQSVNAQTLQQRIKRNVFAPTKCGSDISVNGGETNVRWLAELPSNQLGRYDASLEGAPPARPDAQEWEATLTGLRTLVARNDVIGIDISGPEKYRFDADGKERFKELYNTMAEAALVKGNPLVLRAMIGQGSADPIPGRPYNRDEFQTTKSGEPLHLNRARHNLDTILAALQELKSDGRLRKRHVILRFGNTSRATPAHVVQMRDLGVIAEVSLGSDTGSQTAAQDPNGEHSFLTLIYYQDPILLSTGGQAVAGTTLKDEYKQAYNMVESFLSGERKVRVKYDPDAENHANLPVDGDGNVWLSASDLQTEELDRFLYSYNCLLDSAAQYKAWMTAPAGMALPAIANARVRTDCPRMRL